MEGNIRIVCLLEDVAQQRLIGALINRIAEEAGIRRQRIQHDARVAEPGLRVHERLRRFVKQDVRDLSESGVLLVVAIDCNCKGPNERKKQLEETMRIKPRRGKRGRMPDTHVARNRVVFCLPDPHIERWYITDQQAFNRAIGAGTAPSMPPYKCEQDYYKKVLRDALSEAGVKPLLGGAEYGELIAQELNLQRLSEADAAFESFYNELRRALKLVSSGSI